MNLDETEHDLTLPRRRPKNSEYFDLNDEIDESKDRTARMRAKKDCFVKACSSSFHDNNDEDLKVIDVSPIKSLFFTMNLDKDGTGDESTLVKRRPNDS